jgi:hypothetical protein
METVAIDQLPLLDLQGKPTLLTAHFSEYLLVIFLRHLA